jgi:RNA polymerase sigma-70 factor (ECF subfamily)
LLELGDAPEPTVAPDEDAAGLETAATIRLVLVELPKDQRQAIELAFFGGLSHPEIAEALEQPLGTVKARIRRGLLKMRECLQMKS